MYSKQFRYYDTERIEYTCEECGNIGDTWWVSGVLYIYDKGRATPFKNE